MKRSLPGVVAVCLLAVSACTGGSGSSSSSSSSGGGSSSSGGGGGSLRDGFLALFNAQCAFEERCVQELGRGYSSQQACQAQTAGLVDFYLELVGADFEVADASKQQACVDALYPSSGACVETAGTPAVCGEWLRVRNGIAAGGACSTASEAPPCGFGLTCINATDGCGTCGNIAGVGQACSDTLPCGSGATCTNGTCVALPGRGESCAMTNQCRGNFQCVGTAGAETCQERAASGADCSSGSCFYDLTCAPSGMTQTCQAQSEPGASCGRTAANACRGNACRFATADAATGTCSLDYTTTVGGPCLALGTFNYCSDGWADTTGPEDAPTGCTCRALKAVGEACTSYSQCANACEGIDYTMTPPGPGMCTALVANGGQCFSDNSCVSGFCSNANVCAPLPACN